MRLNNGFEIPQIGVGHLRQTLLMLLLCGVCFACNAPQQSDDHHADDRYETRHP
jgi:hypothetical protein